MALQKLDDIYCEQHEDIHEPVTNPYDGPPTEKDKDGNPIDRPIDR